MIKNKQFTLHVLVLFLASLMQVFSAKGQPISPRFFGQNAWMPDSIGTQKRYGQLDSKWPEIKASAPQIMRFGGITCDKNCPTNYQFIKMIDKIRSNGMEPVIQVPFHNFQYNASKAAEIVRYVNITMGRNVKYWSIGNEPDLEYGYNTAAQVAGYTKSYATAMKAVDPNIKTMGPECAWYNYNIMPGLLTPGGPYDVTGKDANGRFYLDIISFHMYSFNGTQTRAQVLTDLTAQYKFEYNLNDLNNKISAANSYHGRSGSYALKTAVTEANVNFVNPASDNLYSVGANSFVGGQFWAELLSIGMKKSVDFITFWSVVEGNNTAYNVGFLDYVTGKKKPTYYHFQMMSQNFSGTFINGTDNQASVKSFGCRNNAGQIVVMILNQSQSSNYNFSVRLDGASSSSANALKINVNAGVGKEYSGSINNQATQMLVFDGAGNLVKKIDYKLVGHADANLPPTVTTYSGTSTGALTATITVTGGTVICSGASTKLSVNPTTGATYRWKKNGVAITGATATSLTVTSAGSYTVTKTLNGASVTSTAANISLGTVNSTITAASSVNLSAGGSVVLKATASTNYRYQWRKNGVNISGATAANYTATSGGTYTCYITLNGACGKVSNGITVTASSQFVASITPASSTSLALGGNVWLKANTGSGITYKWKKNGVVISGATGASYNATSAGTYTVTETYGLTTSTSNAVTVTVSSTLTAKISVGGSTTIPAGSSVILYSNTGNNYIYQWKKNGVNITGANAATYKVTSSGSYQVKLTFGTANAWSAPVTITVGSTVARVGDTTNTSTNSTTGVEGMMAENTENSTQNGHMFADTKDTVVNTLGANGRRSVDQASARGEGMNKTGAGGRKSSGNQRIEQVAEMDSTTLEKTIKNETGTLSIKAFPNPTCGDLKITLTTVNTVRSDVKLELYNSLGQIVWTKTPIVENGFMNDEIQLDGSIASGDYFLRVREAENTEVMKVCVIR